MTTNVSPLFRLMSLFGDSLTANQLAYRDEHANGDNSRFEAGARIASMKGGVTLWSDWGYATVVSDDPKRPTPYDVCFLPGEMFCPCPDGTNSKHNKSGICKHLAGSLMAGCLMLS